MTGSAATASARLHDLFAEQLAKAPEAVAVEDREGLLTYRELDRRSSQLAHRLRALGVGPEVLVALCLERSLEMIVAVVAVLKAGGAYVPIDPAYPADRIGFVLEDAGAEVLITQERMLE